jgi:hypothetical protein
MTIELPDPLVPAEVDLRDVPIPLDAFIELAMSQFGMTREDAEAHIREICRLRGYKTSAIGHA